MKIQITNAKTGEVEVRDMTASEEEKNNLDMENARLAKESRKTKRDADEADKASANQKLLDLGLTQDEVNAL